MEEKYMVHLMLQSSATNQHPLQDKVIKQKETPNRQDYYLKNTSNRILKMDNTTTTTRTDGIDSIKQVHFSENQYAHNQ
jgi:hypothetical protein